jgi:hypothetical protein
MLFQISSVIQYVNFLYQHSIIKLIMGISPFVFLGLLDRMEFSSKMLHNSLYCKTKWRTFRLLLVIATMRGPSSHFRP